jgi:hypothetical protein
VHADLVGTSGLRLDRFGVDVLEELKATLTVWRLEHRDAGVVAIKADGSVGPLTTDRVTADDREAEVGEKGDRCFEVANGDADVLESDGHALHATERVDSLQWRADSSAVISPESASRFADSIPDAADVALERGTSTVSDTISVDRARRADMLRPRAMM